MSCGKFLKNRKFSDIKVAISIKDNLMKLNKCTKALSLTVKQIKTN